MGDEPEVRNEQGGTVNGPVAQVGNVYGGLHFGGRAEERAVPRQLPPDVAAFAGQADELAALDAVLADSARAVVISAVDNAPGLGRTALAVHWANRVAQRFPDGQLHVDLRGSGEWPARPADVLRSFLAALGDRDIPADLSALEGRYRTLLADKRVLVVLDDARDVDQVRPLLPGGSTSFVVVTSRNPLTGLVAEGARSLGLDALTPGEARDLLARRLGEQRLAAEPQAVAELVELCAGSPLALSEVAARAANTTLADLAGEVRVAVAGTEGLSARTAAVLAWSRGRSEPPEHRDWAKRLAGLTWVRSRQFLFAAAAVLGATVLIGSTELIAASSFLGLGFFALRLALLVAGLVVMEQSGRRGVIGVGLAASGVLYFLVDALVSVHGSADVWSWLELFAVIALAAGLAVRWAPFRAVPRRVRLVAPPRYPLSFVVLGAAAAQFILLFAAFPVEYGSTTVTEAAGALAALLPVVAIGGLCTLAVLTRTLDEAQRTFAGSAVVAYLGPEVVFGLGSLPLGRHFTYLGGALWASGETSAPWVWFAVAQALVSAVLMTSTLALLRRRAEAR
ncbi:hypothetical protein GCM10011581_21660 [Saccharopolyspora subtropica]|uniref:NB-ARC domain-containing protein n=1 Tax=Saccharopolyspora thermophila TaxID=89367 RepID=A0A917JU14_9PSEU|nr:NB-ARC domain-containing protein [Saccharopolyspora subtropica]GGI84144.1 hypothetical protein GCM10011581_21660 [Saccharopolyspora subtropica]